MRKKVITDKIILYVKMHHKCVMLFFILLKLFLRSKVKNGKLNLKMIVENMQPG